MKKAFFATSFLLFLATIVPVKDITCFSRNSYVPTKKNENIRPGAVKDNTYSSDNTDIEILDKTQLLLMNFR